MAGQHFLDTKTLTFNEILANGKAYHVPQFQRDYSWERDNWEDLWNDIEETAQSNSPHYMGSLVFQSTKGKAFLIIDGQQRLTTLTIIALAVIDAIQTLADSGIETVANQERVEILIRQYVGQKDPASLSYSSKIFLNENNNGFFQNRLIRFKPPINVIKLSDSEHLMWEAYLFFRERIRERFKNQSGEELANFLSNVLGELMIFIQITVEDELNAYTVFETLNSRGIQLTSTDLLKNYLFALVANSETDLKHVKAQWKKIIDTIGLQEFPTFMRYFLTATRKSISKEYLFKEIKQFVKSGQDVFDLLDRLEYHAYHYVALGNADDEQWLEDKDNRNAISILKAFKVTQWKPLAMIALEKLTHHEFKRLLQALVTISYRYNVIAKLPINEMEKTYSKSAISLFYDKYQSLSDVLISLRNLYVSNEDFKKYFELKYFNTNNSNERKLARYTLYQLERQMPGGSLYDFETDNGTIEHILPESYHKTWQDEFTEEAFNRNVYLLGNLTLLEPTKNSKEAADKPFDDKKKVYTSSKFAITQCISDPEWTPNNIKKRQAQLAKVATAVWKIQF